MSKRMTVKRSKDRKIFARTAKKTRAVNLNPNVRRGGIRL